MSRYRQTKRRDFSPSTLIKIFLVIGPIYYFPLMAKGWEKVFSQDQIDVYGKEKVKGVIPFKAIGVIDHNIEHVLRILLDHQNKKHWAPKLKEVKIHKQVSEKEYLFSEYYETPWPASDREFLLRGTIEKIGDDYHLNAHSILNKKLENDDHIQADVTKLNLVLKKLEHNKTEISFEFHGDMKGWIPLWVMNIIQKKWPFRFIEQLRNRLDKEGVISQKVK